MQQRVNMKHYSFTTDPHMFRKLDKQDKYNEVVEFIKLHSRIPSTSGSPEPERMLGQFLINSKSAVKNETCQAWEYEMVATINEMAPVRESKIDKITRILGYCEKHKKTPTQSSQNKEEKRLGQLLNSLKVMLNKGLFTDDEKVAFAKLENFRSNYQRPRDEKLSDILSFCQKNDRTPRQHVSDETEKRMAELLSTTKVLASKNKLDEPSKIIFEKIMQFSPLSRVGKLEVLKTFIIENKRTPKINSDDQDERNLAIFLTKIKSLNKENKLDAGEIVLLNDVIKFGKIKTRLDKINDLFTYATSINSIPTLNSDNETERKYAMFFNNIKQCRKLDKLNVVEMDALAQVEAIAETLVKA